MGQALFESCQIDPQSGQVLSATLADYAIPRADELPFFATEIVEHLSPTNPLGIKSGGEGATTPALAATINAIVNALAHLGVTDIVMPATPDNVWRSIRDANLTGARI